jgi:hypothetical protein
LPAFPDQPPPIRHERLASAVPSFLATDASYSTGAGSEMSPADPPDGADGTAQFLNGRGLY